MPRVNRADGIRFISFLLSSCPLYITMDAIETTSKRKRSGKAREEAKARAIAKAEEAAKEAEHVEQAGDEAQGSDAGDGGDGEEAEEDPSKRIPDVEVIRKRVVSHVRGLRLTLLIHADSSHDSPKLSGRYIPYSSAPRRRKHKGSSRKSSFSERRGKTGRQQS